MSLDKVGAQFSRRYPDFLADGWKKFLVNRAAALPSHDGEAGNAYPFAEFALRKGRIVSLAIDSDWVNRIHARL